MLYLIIETSNRLVTAFPQNEMRFVKRLRIAGARSSVSCTSVHVPNRAQLSERSDGVNRSACIIRRKS
jgi:hypothetical protein